jgi:hypothetical protein
MSPPSQPPWPRPTSQTQTYTAHCHCRALSWNFDLSPPLWLDATADKTERVYPVTQCSCSYCARHGVLSVHPKAETVRFTKRNADDSGSVKTTYKTGCKLGEWWLCGRCGCVGGLKYSKESGIVDEDGERREVINVRVSFVRTASY